MLKHTHVKKSYINFEDKSPDVKMLEIGFFPLDAHLLCMGDTKVLVGEMPKILVSR